MEISEAPASVGELTAAEESVFRHLSQKLQRDVNCLSDPDRTTRRRALVKLDKVLVQQEDGHIQEVICRCYLIRVLVGPLVSLLSDPVEKCRELSAGLLISLINKIEDIPEVTGALIECVLPTACKRLGSQPFEETAEEIRLLVLKLLRVLWSKESAQHWGGDNSKQKWNSTGGSATTDTMIVVASALTDPFPDVKRECCALLIRVVEISPEGVRLSLGKLIKPLISNLGHQHAKTRQMTISALGKLLLCGADDMAEIVKDTLLPQIGKLVFDRTAAVRIELAKTLAGVLKLLVSHSCPRMEYLRAFHSKLLVMLITELSDDMPEVKSEAYRLITEIGVIWHESSAEGRVNGAADAESCTAAYCRSLMHEMLPATVDTMGHWTVKQRYRAVQTLSSLITFSGQSGAVSGECVTCYLPVVIPALCSTSGDDEDDVTLAVTECSRSVGAAVEEFSAVTDLLLPILNGQVSGQTSTMHLTQAMLVLTPAISGHCGKRTLAPKLLSDICSAVSSPVLLYADPTEEFSTAWVTLCCTILECTGGTSLSTGSVISLLRALIQLLASCSSAHRAEEPLVRNTMLQLAKASNFTSTEELLSHYFLQILGSILTTTQPITSETLNSENVPKNMPKPPGETKLSVSAGEGYTDKDIDCMVVSPVGRGAFTVLINEGPGALGRYLEHVLPVFYSALKVEREPSVRLPMMVLLERVIGAESVTCSALAPHAVTLINKTLIPSALWHAGAAHAVIRKVAMACIHTALNTGKLSVEALYKTAPDLMPVLKSNLEDGDASTRQLVCLILQHTFLKLPGAFGEDFVRVLYPELLKRLDDASDDVRRASCRAMAAFYKAAPQECIRGVVLEYSTDQLLIHLDDEDPIVQEAVLSVLVVLGTIDPKTVSAKVTEVKSAHRTPLYCEKLLEITGKLL